MSSPEPGTTADHDDAPAQDVVSTTPQGDEPSPEESALAQPQYPTS